MSYQMWFTMTTAAAIVTDVIVMMRVPKGMMLNVQGATWRILFVICFPTLVWVYGAIKSGITMNGLNSEPIAIGMFFVVMNMLIFISIIVYRFAMGER